MRFREFVEKNDFVDFIIESFENAPIDLVETQDVQQLTQYQKPWSAKKSEILQMWRQVKPNLPVIMTPMHKNYEGKTRSYGEDGIRITGSWQFIAAIIGRLKELLFYENPNSKLRLIFKAIDSSKNARPDRQSYVFYINAQDRGKKR